MRPRADIAHARPYHADRVLVKRIPPPPDGRLVLIENQEGREKVGHQFGVVVAVTGEVYDCQPGDRVIYARWPANEFEHEGETHTFLYEEQSILCVLD
jgi:co-chaperonin GroES (HSP10)